VCVCVCEHIATPTETHFDPCCNTRCNTHFNVSKHSPILCITPQHTATHLAPQTATHAKHRNTLQQRLQHTSTHCSTLEFTATHPNTLQLTATHCNTDLTISMNSSLMKCCNATLQHTATYCNTPQHIATCYNTYLDN